MYSISGTIQTSTGAAINGVTVTLSGTGTGTTTTDASGNYTFSNVINGSYAVTPTKTNYTFAPTNRNITISGANQTGQNFTGTYVPPTYSISGTVTTSTGAAINGVTVTLSGTGTGTATTDASGNYTLSNVVDGSYAVTPSKTDYTFAPVNINVTISGANQSNQNFTGTYVPPAYSISGYVLDNSSAGITNATVSLSGSASSSQQTGSNGAFSFAGLLTGNYTVTATTGGWIINPENKSYTNLSANQAGQNYFGVMISTPAPAYSISGTIQTSTGAAINGVTVTLSGSGTGSTTTDASGNYIFNNVIDGSYAVTPAKANYTFAPTNRNITISGANQTGQNFAGTYVPPTYSISGTVTTSTGAAINGVTVTLSGTGTGTATTDASGNYTLSNVIDGGYTLTPTRTDYTFSPVNISVTVNSANQTGQNFAGTYVPPTYSISGTVTTSTGAAINGVTVTLSGTGTGSTTTDASGNYTFSNVVDGSYAVTPTRTNYTFAPANINVTISGSNQPNQDFTGTYVPPTYSISGTVQTSTGAAINGVTVTLSGTGSGSTTTDASGNYIFSNLVNGSYAVTPAKTNYTFAPTDINVTLSGDNQNNQNFTGTFVPPTYSISGTIQTSTSAAINGVTVTLSGTGSGSTTTDASGNYTFSSLVEGTYTIIPIKAQYLFVPASIILTLSAGNLAGQNFTGTYSPPEYFYWNMDSIATPQPPQVGVSTITKVITSGVITSTTGVTGASNTAINIGGWNATARFEINSPEDIDPEQGVIEYWWRPNYNGRTGSSLNVFSSSGSTISRLYLQKTGASGDPWLFYVDSVNNVYTQINPYQFVAQAGRWYKWKFVWDRAASRIEIWVDDVRVDNATVYNASAWSQIEISKFVIGNSPFAAGATANGSLDEFYIYPTANGSMGLFGKSSPPDSKVKFGDVYSYPNPAKNGANPKIHIECGLVDNLELRVYNVAAELMLSKQISGNDWFVVNGKYCYEYELNSQEMASGVYLYSIKAELENEISIKSVNKFTVIK